MQRPTSLGSIRRSLATLAVVLCVFWVPISAASAHDSLTGSNPDDGQTVKTMPGAIKLTFTSPPMALGSKVVVEDADGKNWATNDVDIVDNVATQAISPGAPAGAYKVVWRVVSSDSHPVEGSLEFTATSAAHEGGATASPSAAPASPPAAASATDSLSAPAEPVDPVAGETASTFPTTTVVVLAAFFAVVVIAVVVVSRRRLGRDDD